MTPTRCSTLILTTALLASSACSARARFAAVDVEGRAVDPFQAGAAKAIVLVFVRTDCPISNRYAPEIRRLAEKFAPRGVAFYPTYPDRDASTEAIRAHMREYGIQGTALRDPNGHLVRMTKARVTPEAAVFLPDGRIVYSGGIDDWYADLGKPRAEATAHYLEDALEALLDGRPVAHPHTEAVGCSLADLK